VPAEDQIKVGFERLTALGSPRQIREKDPGGDLDRLPARWQRRLIRDRHAREPQERGDAKEE
jgi:hypothetical protein